MPISLLNMAGRMEYILSICFLSFTKNGCIFPKIFRNERLLNSLESRREIETIQWFILEEWSCELINYRGKQFASPMKNYFTNYLFSEWYILDMNNLFSKAVRRALIQKQTKQKTKNTQKNPKNFSQICALPLRKIICTCNVDFHIYLAYLKVSLKMMSKAQ